MPVIAIVGAGQGLGLSIARVFGKHGFAAALVSRSQANLDHLSAQLNDEGIAAAGFAADVMDRPSLSRALSSIEDQLGAIEVMEYSPASGGRADGITPVTALDVTVANMQPSIDHQLHGAIAATNQVLPGMLERAKGALFYTTGASSVEPSPKLGNFGPAAAALRHWVLSIHPVLARSGVYAAHVAIGVFIGRGGLETQADTIAEVYWDLYTTRVEPERRYGSLPEQLKGVD